MCAPLPAKLLINESGSTAWTYNAQGRLATKTQTTGTLTNSIGYGYDAAGCLD